MLDALIKLLTFQFLGEATVSLLSLPVPGPVAGMLLLLLYLLRSGRMDSMDDKLAGLSGRLLRHMTLLFIPSAVGITLHMERLRNEWRPILAALVVSTLVAIVVTAALAHWLRHDK